MKIAMVFPGYGSQFVGMSKELYDESRLVQEYFEEASNCLNNNFVKLCFASSDAEIRTMHNAYPSIFLVSSAIHAVLESEGIKPDFITGYNLGELSTLFAAGSINFPDGLYILSKLGNFYQELLDTAAVTIIAVHNVPEQALKEICHNASSEGSRADIALYGGEYEHVVSGHSAALEHVRDIITQNYHDATIDEVPIEFGLHSDLMAPVADQFKMYLEKVDFKDVKIPIVSGLDGNVITEGAEIKERLVRWIHSPLVWSRVMTVLAEADVIVEVGPGTTLHDVLKARYPEKRIIAVNKRNDIEKLKIMIMTTDVEL
jgi:[acyl-carrier-protein] S-malonyltransferase